MQEPGYMRDPMFATATFGLRLALRLFVKSNNDGTPHVRYYSVCLWNLTPNELMHVHRLGEGTLH